MATRLKIMSFNLRNDHAEDGANHFSCRKARLIEYLNREKADVIGFQEVTTTMRSWLVETFPDYYMVGVGRSAKCLGETCLIAFRKDTMALVSCDTVMLSSTPRLFGSRYDGSDQSRCPREYVRACLKHCEIDEPFYIYNVHTDHIGQISRMLASNQLLQDITSHGAKFFMTGDFNATPDAPEISMITKCQAREIVDASAAMGGSFHGFGNKEIPTKIDYIFTDASIEVSECVCVEDKPSEGEPYLSDHNPIYIVAEL